MDVNSWHKTDKTKWNIIGQQRKKSYSNTRIPWHLIFIIISHLYQTKNILQTFLQSLWKHWYDLYEQERKTNCKCICSKSTGGIKCLLCLFSPHLTWADSCDFSGGCNSFFVQLARVSRLVLRPLYFTQPLHSCRILAFKALWEFWLLTAHTQTSKHIALLCKVGKGVFL